MIETVISWNAHTFAPDYEVDFVQGTQPGLPPMHISLLERVGAWPVVAALQRKPHKLALLIKILDYTRLDDLRSQLFGWFDPEDETPKALVVENHAGIPQYVNALCEELRLYSDPRHQEVFVVTLAVDGDVRWRAVTEDSDAWNIAVSGAVHDIDNDSEDEVYPVYTIEPTVNKVGGYAYRRWVPIKWCSANSGQRYPVMAMLDTAVLVGAGKMQADCDDLMIFVDGISLDPGFKIGYKYLGALRWLDAPNTDHTKIWFNVNFAGAPTLTLKTAIAGAGDLDSIEMKEDISQLPDSGILMIDDEAFIYSARNLTDCAVTGIIRAAKGTSMAAHLVDEDVFWIQHDVYIVYGNPTAVIAWLNAIFKPAFELDTSDNETWVYEVFGDTKLARTGRWEPIGLVRWAGDGGCYTLSHGGIVAAGEYGVIGLWLFGIGQTQSNAYGWWLHNPCGIVNVEWDGEYIYTGWGYLCHLGYWIRGKSWWTWQATIGPPAMMGVWEAWHVATADFEISDDVAIMLYFWNQSYVEANAVTVTLNDVETPIVTVNAEQGNYHLQATLTNQTTAEAVALEFVMDLNSELEIDTYNHVVTWLLDGSRQLQILTLSGTRETPLAKRAWLRLLPGTNTLRFDDTGTAGVTITTDFVKRYR